MDFIKIIENTSPIRMAVDWTTVIGTITPPTALANLGSGGKGLGAFLTILISVAFIAAGAVFLIMMILGAFQWITSGGDKEALSKARGRINNAIIGISIIALSFLIVNVILRILGLSIFG